MNIIRNTNDFEKEQADWYEKIPGKKTWGYFKTHFETALRQLQKVRGNTIWGIAYHQAKLLRAETNHHVLGELIMVKNNIIEALKDHNK